jgi:hypothetical protein
VLKKKLVRDAERMYLLFAKKLNNDLILTKKCLHYVLLVCMEFPGISQKWHQSHTENFARNGFIIQQQQPNPLITNKLG